MDERTKQLAEVWRVAKLKYGGKTVEMAAVTGPLGLGSLANYRQVLKDMLLGQRYTRAMKNDDTEYFLTQIEQEFGDGVLRLALSAMDEHILYFNTLGRGSLIGARTVHDSWSAKLTSHGSIPLTMEALAAQEATALTVSMERSKDDREARLAAADPVPKVVTVTVSAFRRNPDVVVAVLIRANGMCEACRKPAPFFKLTDGNPYLEVHHRLPLAEKGHDTVANAIALCPNCHREAHSGADFMKFRS